MPWDTDESSGLLTHFVGTVKESVWTTDAQKEDPNAPFLQWNVTVDDVLQESFQGTVPESLLVNITIGKGWVEDETGETVEHKDNLEMFKASSAYGKIIGLVAGKSDSYGSNAKAMDGDGDIKVDLTGVAKYMAANGYDDPRVSSIWNGLTFEFRGIGFVYRSTQGEPYAQSLPVRLVDGAAPTPKKAKAAPKATLDTVGVWTSNGADEATANTLNDLANSAKNHADFARQALVLPEVTASDDLKAAVLDESVFN